MALRTSSMLARWAQFSPGTRMPDDIKELPLTQQAALSNADPELHALLGNTANAELELAAMSGALADVAPDPQALKDAATRAEVDRLIAEGAFPTQGYYRELPNGESEYVAPTPGNITSQLLIAQLDPQRYESEMMKANPPAPVPGALSAEAAARVNARVAAARAESLNHGSTLVDQGDY
jgi:hypothetical protein